jgi:hypothetical protein
MRKPNATSMYIDIVFPDDNEAEFISMAKRLGYGALCFVYDRKHQLPEPQGMRLVKGLSVGAKTGGRPNAEALVARIPDRAVIERLKPDIIFDLEQQEKRDFMHSRNSGMNHIIAAFCKRKGISVGFSASSVIDDKIRARTIGRMRQNIRLCRKYGLHMAVASFAREPYMMRAPQDLASLFITIGMHQKEAHEGLMLHE